MAPEFVHTDPFFHKSIVLDGTPVADKRTIGHMWADAVRTTDGPATTQTADGANPGDLLSASCTNPRVGWR
ncbi:hypothetical protein [Paenibacillus illinoisensis]|uniref:hypothetical protein n=1 Tax=Paenibacillus illinoisensis TaxID=59845 RepID=UPI001C8E4AE4|nr:hypothetical protein [Paenibacillus illinoisensis]MBY0217271.1 hypothetical protein [Paenibacillus illinoisensis]